MRLTQATLWGTVLSLIGISGSADPDVISNHQAVNQAIFTLSTISLAGVILNQVWPGPLEAVAGLVRHRLPGIGEGPFIPLSQAARELYEFDKDGLIGRGARDSKDPVRWCARWIAPRFPEIYGRRAPSTMMERIPPEVFTYARFEDGGDRVTGADQGDYVGVSVRRRTFRAALPAIRAAHLTGG